MKADQSLSFQRNYPFMVSEGTRHFMGWLCQGGELKFSGVNCLGLTFKYPEKYIQEKCLSIFISGKNFFFSCEHLTEGKIQV